VATYDKRMQDALALLKIEVIAPAGPPADDSDDPGSDETRERDDQPTEQ